MKTIYEYIGLAAVTFLNLFVFAKPLLPLLKAKRDHQDGETSNQITDHDKLDKKAITNEQTNQTNSHDEKFELISAESRKAKGQCDFGKYVDSNWLDEIDKYILNLPDFEVTNEYLETQSENKFENNVVPNAMKRFCEESKEPFDTFSETNLLSKDKLEKEISSTNRYDVKNVKNEVPFGNFLFRTPNPQKTGKAHIKGRLVCYCDEPEKNVDILKRLIDLGIMRKCKDKFPCSSITDEDQKQDVSDYEDFNDNDESYQEYVDLSDVVNRNEVVRDHFGPYPIVQDCIDYVETSSSSSGSSYESVTENYVKRDYFQFKTFTKTISSNIKGPILCICDDAESNIEMLKHLMDLGIMRKCKHKFIPHIIDPKEGKIIRSLKIAKTLQFRNAFPNTPGYSFIETPNILYKKHIVKNLTAESALQISETRHFNGGTVNDVFEDPELFRVCKLADYSLGHSDEIVLVASRPVPTFTCYFNNKTLRWSKCKFRGLKRPVFHSGQKYFHYVKQSINFDSVIFL